MARVIVLRFLLVKKKIGKLRARGGEQKKFALHDSRSPGFCLCSSEIRKKITPVLQASRFVFGWFHFGCFARFGGFVSLFRVLVDATFGGFAIYDGRHETVRNRYFSH